MSYAGGYTNLAETYRRRAEELERKAALVEAFGCDDDYQVEAVIFFKRRFESRSYCPVFTYCAVKVDDDLWFTTDKMRQNRYTFRQLVEEHLAKALEESGEVWLATKWVSLV